MTTRRTRIASYGLLWRESRLLLCRISAELPRWQGQWTLPGGGIDFGEHPADAMVREVLEETGFRVEPLGVRGVSSLHDPSGPSPFHGIRVIYDTRIAGGELRFETSGTSDRAEWFTPEDIARLPRVELVDEALAMALN